MYALSGDTIHQTHDDATRERGCQSPQQTRVSCVPEYPAFTPGDPGFIHDHGVVKCHECGRAVAIYGRTGLDHSGAFTKHHVHGRYSLVLQPCGPECDYPTDWV